MRLERLFGFLPEGVRVGAEAPYLLLVLHALDALRQGQELHVLALGGLVLQQRKVMRDELHAGRAGTGV